jgi:hypothetical protein
MIRIQPVYSEGVDVSVDAVENDAVGADDVPFVLQLVIPMTTTITFTTFITFIFMVTTVATFIVITTSAIFITVTVTIAGVGVDIVKIV